MRFILKNIKVFWTVISILLLALSGLYLGITIRNENLSSTDSNAIYGGDLEYGYPSAGYILSYKNITEATICGVVQLDSDLLITAAHCINNTSNVFLNTDDLSNQISLTELDAIFYKKEEWDGITPTHDLAAILYKDTGDTTNFAGIGTPEISCGYRVVGYGRTENDLGTISTIREKKSTSLCIENLDSNILILSGDGGGICLGDSGSPIYKDGTNQLVGIISSVIVGNEDDDPCYIGNKAVAVRADTNIDFINNVALGDIENVSASNSGDSLNNIDTVNANISSNNRLSDSTSLPFNFDFGSTEDDILGIPLVVIQGLYFISVLAFGYFLVRIWFRSNTKKRGVLPVAEGAVYSNLEQR